jgi:hypothetical protein
MSFSDLQAQLACAALVGHVPTVSSLTGGVAVGMGNLSLKEQGAANSGTPVIHLHSFLLPKVYFPGVVKGHEEMCLAIIGQGLSFCLHTSCPTVSHWDARRFLFTEGDYILIHNAKDVAFCEPTLPF